MTDRFDAAEAFAYVDDCLAPVERRAFEARLQQDPDLRREIALWEAQNGAIRAAFGAKISTPAAIDLGRNSNENLPVWMAASAPNRRAAASQHEEQPHTWPARAKAAAASPRPPIEQPAPRRAHGRALAIATFAAALIFAVPPGGASWPRDKMVAAGLAAYRAFATPAALTSVEMRASDPDALTRWFAPQFARAVLVPKLPPSGLRLIGGRIAPGTTTSAAFVVYEDARGGRVGLLIEPLDSPAPSRPSVRQLEGLSFAAWTDANRGLVAVGADRNEVAELARLLEMARAAGH